VHFFQEKLSYLILSQNYKSRAGVKKIRDRAFEAIFDGLDRDYRQQQTFTFLVPK